MAVRVIDKTSQQERDVSPAEAQEGLASGQYAVKAGQKVTVGNEYEGYTDVDPAELQSHLDQGSHIGDADEARAWALSREESDLGSMALGTLESAGRGASLGLSDLALTGFGVDAERMRARQEGLGGVGTAIELGTGLATMIGTGGAGAFAKGAASQALARRAASSVLLPARGVSRLGARVEAGLGSMLPEAAPSLVKSMVPLAGRGAVEGYAANVGHSISESALGDTDLTAEQLLIHDGFLGAALGGGAGAAVPLIGRALSAGARIPISAAKSIAGKVSAGKWDEGVIRTIGKASGDGAQADILASLPRSLRSRVTSGDPKLVAEVAEAVRAPIRTAVNDAMEAQAALLKTGRVRTKSLSAVDDKVIPRMSMDRIQAQGEQLARVAAENADTSAYLTRQLKTALKEQAVARKAIEEGSAKGSYRALSNYRNRLDGELEELGGLRVLDDPATDIQTRNTVGFLRDARDDVDGFLGDESIFRDVAQAHRGAIDASTARQVAGRDLKDMLGKLDDDSVATRFAIEGESMSGLDGMLDSLEKMAKNMDVPSDVASKIAKARASRKIVDEAVSANRQAATGIDAWAHVGGVDRTVGRTVGTLAREGALAAGVGYGPAGWLAAKGIEAATNPVGLLRGVSAVAAAVDVVAKHLDGPIKTIGTLARAGGRAVAPVTARAAGAGLTRAQRIERVEAVRDGAARMADVNVGDPLKASLYDLDSVAPQVAQAVRSKTTEIARFLVSKAPSLYRDPFAPPSRPPMIDSAQLDQYERYVTAVTDPVSVVEHVADGTATYEEVDALRTVYPSIFAQVRRQITDKVLKASAEGHELPQAQRISISMMIDMPLDASLEPAALAANQRAIQVAPPPDMPSSGASMAKSRAPVSSGKAISKIAKGLALPTDRLSTSEKA